MSPREKAIASVLKVQSYFKERGFVIASSNNPNSNGHDLTAIKDNQVFTIEIKSAIESIRCWKVNKCITGSKYIAIVMPTGQIHFESMKSHSKDCDKSGARRITDLVALYKHC